MRLFTLVCLAVAFTSSIAFASSELAAVPMPTQPTDPAHPGSSVTPYSYSTVGISGGTLFLPKAKRGEKFPVIVFGHGRLVPMFAYDKTLAHLAGKGIAVIFPDYSQNSQEENPDNSTFERYGQNYAEIADRAVKQYSQYIDGSRMIYSGSSNGARTSLMAAAIASSTRGITVPRSVIVFETAGFDSQWFSKIHPEITVTVVNGDADDKISPAHGQRIYNALPVKRKQFLIMRSYTMTNPRAIADHGFIRTWDWTGPRLSALHYYGAWKLLVGAAHDLVAGAHINNVYAYGDLLETTGIPGFSHEVTRNW